MWATVRRALKELRRILKAVIWHVKDLLSFFKSMRHPLSSTFLKGRRGPFKALIRPLKGLIRLLKGFIRTLKGLIGPLSFIWSSIWQCINIPVLKRARGGQKQL